MKKNQPIVFMATPEQRARVDEMARTLGKTTSGVMRDLIDAAAVVKPVITFPKLGQTECPVSEAQHGA